MKLTDEERELIAAYRSANKQDRKTLLRHAKLYAADAASNENSKFNFKYYSF